MHRGPPSAGLSVSGVRSATQTRAMTDDPGGNFASDEHRRVMANLPNPDQTAMTEEELLAGPIARDDYLDIDAAELDEILADLEADGDASHLKSGWKNTKAGWKVLTGLIAEDGGRNYELRSEK